MGGRWQAMPSVVSWIKGPPSPVLAPVVAPAEHAGYVFVCVCARERACLCFYECMHACVQLTAFHWRACVLRGPPVVLVQSSLRGPIDSDVDVDLSVLVFIRALRERGLVTRRL